MKQQTTIRRAAMTLVGLLALVFALALPASALAKSGNPAVDPTASQYSNPADNGTDQTDPGDDGEQIVFTATGDDDSGDPTPTAAGAGSGSLPFTGFDVGVLALVAVLLGAAGLALRRLSAVR